MRMVSFHLVIGLALLTAIAAARPALAATCAGSPIEARGEASRFQWIAKAKARASWRARVRATPGLGPAYANWSHAENTEERCITGPKDTLCVFTGLPCLK